MEASTLPELDEGAPVEEGAEATRSTEHLFKYQEVIHVGAGADVCEGRDTGRCKDVNHVHAVVVLPNRLQIDDIDGKQRAAKARKKRAMRDSGTDTRPASDAYVTLESELDDLLGPNGNRERVIRQIAERETRKHFGEHVIKVREEPRFEHYEQNAEEYRRQLGVAEEDRDADEFATLDAEMEEFAETVESMTQSDLANEIRRLGNLDEEALRAIVRDARIEGEAEAAGTVAYYTWVGFIGVRHLKEDGLPGKRYYQTLEDFRNAPPEVIEVVDIAIRELESRLARGGAAGN